MVIARQTAIIDNNANSLLHGEIFSSLDSSDTQKIKKGSSAIHITITPRNSTTFIITLKKPIDLASGTLMVHLQKSSTPLTMAVTVRDSNFFSNSLHPATSEITDETVSYVKVPVDLKSAGVQNANLYRINQITFSFYPTATDKTQWVLIKDITMN